MNKKQWDDFEPQNFDQQMNQLQGFIEKNIEMGLGQLGNILDSTGRQMETTWKEVGNQMQDFSIKDTVNKAVRKVFPKKEGFQGNKYRLKNDASGYRAMAWSFFGVGTGLAVLSAMLLLDGDFDGLLCLLAVAVGFEIASFFSFRIAKLARQASRYFELMEGKKECSVEELAIYTETHPRTVVEQLQQIKDKNWIKNIVFSPDKSRIFSDIAMYEKAAEEYRKKIAQQSQPKPKMAADSAQEPAFLREIRTLNETVQDPVVHEKVEKIYEIAQNIFEQSKEMENPPSTLKKFENYYLPTTVKLLRVYTEIDDQPVDGVNIETIRQDIPSILDTLIKAYQVLLDSLYANMAMDVSSEIAVLKDMLAQEGLTETENTIRPQ